LRFDTEPQPLISRTALTAAAARAAHPLVDDEPHVFVDPLAATLLGGHAAELLAYHREHGDHPVLAEARAQVGCRSRVAEDLLADAVTGPGRTLVAWLGVVMYLTAAEIATTLAALPPCELVVDHMLPPGLRDAAGDAYVAAVGPVAERDGEPWRTFLSPGEMAAALDDHGFEVVRQLRQRDLPDMLDRTDALRPTGLSVITHARHRLS
jgi:O-methyltransferase involved in polyketide biosynthesis